MAKQVKKPKAEIATIDCSLVTIETASGEFGFDTASSISVEPQIDEQEAITLIVKGILRAQKPIQSTLTGNQITLSDNVFNPELVQVLQGGTIVYSDANPDEIIGYNPPAAGSPEKGTVFTLNAYTAQYDAAGLIVKYEKIAYPNCQGTPVAFTTEDNVFRIPEYIINSAPRTGESAYTLTYVAGLPVLVDEYEIGELDVTSEAGTASGSTTISVTPVLSEPTNKYRYIGSVNQPTPPVYGTIVSTGYTDWDGISDITLDPTLIYIMVVEVDSAGKALSAGFATVTLAS